MRHASLPVTLALLPLFAAALCLGLPHGALAAKAKPAPKAAAAVEPSFAVVNLTGETVRVESKTGTLTFLEVAPRTIDAFTCPAAQKLCFDKSDGTAKVKVVRLDPRTPDEWSGTTCRKIYLSPGETLAVDYDLDRTHIVCRQAVAADFARPFSTLDLDKDGTVSASEAASNRIPPETFKAMDTNHDGVLDQQEYESAFDKINILKGIPF
ncbi:EF-Hand domain protein [Desulfovibrio sp. X2]|uniref:EF-Hand domain protein n=1 Tax=Desulfovibrio sp. X2 TaxID=941449 RepID=UPI000358B9C2|nr:EF-Hand domain protein [Desulfovibrio sp. X2]EPR38679.1 EF-Hand domain protein [Desulfovibrio sp. X2]